MAGLGLQLQNTTPLIVSANAAVLFNEILVNSDTNVTYNPADGMITFINAGQYYVSWFVTVKTALGVFGPSFSVVTNETPSSSYTAGSGIKNGEIFGSAVLTVTAGFSISLRNELATEVTLSDVVPKLQSFKTFFCTSIQSFSSLIVSLSITTVLILADVFGSTNVYSFIDL